MKKDAVGKKIKKLMAEGKPKKQAIAIALSMQEDETLKKNMRKKK
jgi:uncharacterized protein YoaH (UPF0181 family)|tara:strand:- start:145 stop:279 length:135 start_codon:yes stop_codon:yes gene_type:complete